MPWFLTPHGPHFVVEPGTIDEYERRDYVVMTAQQAADYFAGVAFPDPPSFATEAEVPGIMATVAADADSAFAAAQRAASVAAVKADLVASTTAAGIVELATNGETTTGTDTVRAVTPAGLKVVADTKIAKGALFANVKDYGAVGDGTADDSAAIRTALASGLPVYVPAGTYRVSQEGGNAWALNLPAGTRLHGPGKLQLAPGVAPAVRVLRAAAAGVAIDGLTIDGNRATQSVEANAQRHGIVLSSGAGGARLSNLTLTGCAGDGVLITDCSDVQVTNCRTTNCERNGVTVYNNTDDVTIIGCHLEAEVQPIDSEPTAGMANNVRILGNYLRSVGNGYALTIAGTSAATPSRGWSVIGNTLIGALYFINQEAAKVVGNTIDARSSTALSGVQAQFASSDILLANNEILAAPNSYGINLQLSTGARPVGWKVLSNLIKTSGAGARGINMTGVGPTLVSGNTIRGANGEVGIQMQATGHMDSVNVTDNSVEGFGVGIYAAPFSTFELRRLRIVGNRVVNEETTPNSTYGIRLSGAAAQFLSTVVRENAVGAGYGSPIDLGSVTVGPVLSYSRTGESTQAAAIRAALVTLGLVKDSTTA